MSRVDIVVVLDAVQRQSQIVRANWPRAMNAAREFDADGLASSGELGGGSGGGDGSSVVERAALSRSSNAAVRELEQAARALDRASARLAQAVLAQATPTSRNVAGGRVVTDCGNPYGCPTKGAAKKRGLCEACWNFEDSNGRHRLAEDVAEALERQRMGAIERRANR